MRFIDDEQYYRWLRLSLTFSIILLMLTTPGLTLQELEFAGVKFGVAGTNLLRLFILCGAGYAVLQYWVTSWMAARRSTLFTPADGIGVVAAARSTVEAASNRLKSLQNVAAESEKLPLLSDPAAVRIAIGDLEFSGITMRPAFLQMRSQLAECAREAVVSAQGDGELKLCKEQLDHIAKAAAELISDELYARFGKSLHAYDSRVNQTAFHVGELGGRFSEAVQATGLNLDNAVRRLAKLHVTLMRLDVARDAKFVFLELVPISVLFALASYHYVALFNPGWPTLFQHITP